MADDASSGSESTLLNIVSVLDEQGMSGVTEVADRLNVAKSTAHYHLNTLEENRLVVRDGSKYKLSLEFLKIGFRTRNRIRLYQAGKEEVDKLGRKSGELAIMMIEQRGLGVFLYKSGGAEAVDIDASIGDTASLHNRALGKAMMAHFPEEKVDRIISTHGLPATTSQTLSSREEFLGELDEVRKAGVAFNRKESIEGIHGVAVPILNSAEEVLGALSIAGPANRLRGSTFTEKFPYLLSKARNAIELDIEHASNM